MAGSGGWRAGLSLLWLSFPLCGNGLCNPLDSGLRRAATGVLGGLFPTPLYRLRPVGVPSRRIQDFLSINDERGWGSGTRQAWQRGCRDGDNPIPTPVVIPAKAGIHAYRDVSGRAASGTGRRGREAGG